ERDPGHVAAGPGVARHELLLYRERDVGEDHRDGRGGPARRAGRLRPRGADHVHLEVDELTGETRQLLRATVGPARLDREVPAFLVAKSAQPLAERVEIRAARFLAGRRKPADPIRARRALGE